jgi:hypothetical protein
MFLRKLAPILTCIAIVLVVITSLMIKPATVLANPGMQGDINPDDGCTGSWVFPPLFVGGDDGVVFAQAAYEFDEHCKPVLVNQIRLNYVPDSYLGEEQEPFETRTVSIIPPPPPTE